MELNGYNQLSAIVKQPRTIDSYTIYMGTTKKYIKVKEIADPEK
jgi:hypothetical protein